MAYSRERKREWAVFGQKAVFSVRGMIFKGTAPGNMPLQRLVVDVEPHFVMA
jgi:hypothetical protein